MSPEPVADNRFHVVQIDSGAHCLNSGTKAFIKLSQQKSSCIFRGLGEPQSCLNDLVVPRRYQIIARTCARFVKGVHWHFAKGLNIYCVRWQQGTLAQSCNFIALTMLLATAFYFLPGKMKLILAEAWGTCRYVPIKPDHPLSDLPLDIHVYVIN